MSILSYEVGALFRITDEATPTLTRLGEAFGVLDKRITELQAKMGAVGKGEGLFGGLAAGITELTASFDRLSVKAGAAGDAIVSAMDRGAAAAVKAAREINAAVNAASRMGAGAAADGGGSGGGGGRSGSPYVMPNVPLIGAPRPNYIDVPFEPIDRLRLGGPGGDGGGPGGVGGPPLGPTGFTMSGGTGGGAHGGYLGNRTPQTLGSPGISPSGSAGQGAIGMVEIAEALLGWREFRLAAEEDLALRQSEESLNVRPDDKEFGPMMARLKKTAQAATDKTIVSEPEGAKMLQHFAGIMIGSGEMGLEQVETLFPIAARLAELSHQRTGEALGPAAVAGGEFAHLTGNYTPTAMEPLLDLINAISKRTNTTIGQQQQIQRYGMPMAIAAGLTPEDAAIEMAFAELNMGATTRVGTAFGQFVTASLTGGQPKTVQQHVRRSEAVREFEQSMRLEDPEGLADHQRTMKDPRQLAAMKELGLVDQKTNAHLNLDDRGNLNLPFEKAQILSYATTHNPQEVTTTLKDAFGQIGFREAELFIKQDALERQGMLRGEKWSGAGPRLGVLGAPSVSQEQADLMRSPMQEFQQFLAQSDTILSTLAGSTLPAFQKGLEGLNAILGGTKNWLREHPDEQLPIAASVGGLILGGAGGAMNWAAKNVSGMKGVAGRGLGGVLGVGGGILSLFGLAQAGKDVLEWGSDSVMDSIWGQGSSDTMRYQHALDSPIPSMRPGGYLGPKLRDGWVNPILPQPAPITARSGPRPENLPETTASGEPRGAAPITITIHNQMSGIVDEKTLMSYLEALAAKLTSAISHYTGMGQGTHQSPYVTNGSM